MKKTLVTLAAIAGLSAAAFVPTAAPAVAHSQPSVSFGIHGNGFSLRFGTPRYRAYPYKRVYHDRYRYRNCTWTRERVWTRDGPVWTRVRTCW